MSRSMSGKEKKRGEGSIQKILIAQMQFFEASQWSPSVNREPASLLGTGSAECSIMVSETE